MRAITDKAPIGTLIAVFAAVALAVAVLPAMADGADNEVRIKKIVKCEDGECTETIENLGDGDDVEVIVADGMKKHVIKRRVQCDGEDCEHHEGAHKMVFVGDGGDIRVMGGGEGHAWMQHGGGTFLGVGLTELTDELRSHFGVPEGAGVMVGKVVDGSPAFKAGIEVGDIITAINAETIGSGSGLASKIRGHEAGAEVAVSFYRGGALQQVSAALEKREGGRHAEHMSGERMRRKIMIECDSDDGECEPHAEIAGLDDFDCGGAKECEVKVECDGGDCTCTVNGESADCAGIPGVPGE